MRHEQDLCVEALMSLAGFGKRHANLDFVPCVVPSQLAEKTRVSPFAIREHILLHGRVPKGIGGGGQRPDQGCIHTTLKNIKQIYLEI